MVDKIICSRCVMDSDIPGIMFDEKGVCNYCKIHDRLEEENPSDDSGKQKLIKLIDEIKEKGKTKTYDCVVGVSGGTDSTYLLRLTKEFGLRPLVVHVDNGWDSEIAANNIKKVTTKLDVGLRTIAVDWEEFRDLQLAFLKASVPDVEIPTDHAIKSTLYHVAAEEGIHYILDGHSFRTEGKVPTLWSYGDARYIQSVYKQFGGQRNLKNFPLLPLHDLFYLGFIKKIRRIRPLYYLDYRKEQAKKIPEKEFGWMDYGGKHYESIYTRFSQSYILPKKFKIDKRKVHYSALIRSTQMTRGQALEELKKPPISELQAQEDRTYVIKKLGLTNEEFEEIMSQKPKTFMDYRTNYNLIKRFRTPIKFIHKLISPTTSQIFYAMDSTP